MAADVPEDVRDAVLVAGKEERDAETVMRDRHIRFRQQRRRGDHLRQAIEQARPFGREAFWTGIGRGRNGLDRGIAGRFARANPPREFELARCRAMPGRHVHRHRVRSGVAEGKPFAEDGPLAEGEGTFAGWRRPDLTLQGGDERA